MRQANPPVYDARMFRDRLISFFEAYRYEPRGDVALADRLRRFLDEFRKYPAEEKTPAILPDYSALQNFFATFRSHYKKSWENGDFIDFWQLADLKRNEVRNSRILSWFLDPAEPHGYGAELFHAWMKALLNGNEFENLRDKIADKEVYRVSTEVNPFSDQSNRFDIEIDSDAFYLCIEVKIDASEGSDQLARYAELTERKAGDRPWAVVFLTPRGNGARTSNEERIIAASWRGLAAAIRAKHPTLSHAHLPSRLLNQFLHAIDLF